MTSGHETPSTNLMDYINLDDDVSGPMESTPGPQPLGTRRRAHSVRALHLAGREWRDPSCCEPPPRAPRGGGGFPVGAGSDPEPNYLAEGGSDTHARGSGQYSAWTSNLHAAFLCTAIILMSLFWICPRDHHIEQHGHQTLAQASGKGALLTLDRGSVAETEGMLQYTLVQWIRQAQGGGVLSGNSCKNRIRVLLVGGTPANLLLELRDSAGVLSDTPGCEFEIDYVGFMLSAQRRRELSVSREVKALDEDIVERPSVERAAKLVCRSMGSARDALADGLANLTSDSVLSLRELGGNVAVRARDALDWDGGDFCEVATDAWKTTAEEVAGGILNYVRRPGEALANAVDANAIEDGQQPYDIVIVYEELLRLASGENQQRLVLQRVAGMLNAPGENENARSLLSGITLENRNGGSDRLALERSACAAGLALRNVMPIPYNRNALRATERACVNGGFSGLFSMGRHGNEEDAGVCEAFLDLLKNRRALGVYSMAREDMRSMSRACRWNRKGEL